MCLFHDLEETGTGWRDISARGTKIFRVNFDAQISDQSQAAGKSNYGRGFV